MALSEEARREIAKARQNAQMWSNYQGKGWDIGASNKRIAEDEARRRAEDEARMRAIYEQGLKAGAVQGGYRQPPAVSSNAFYDNNTPDQQMSMGGGAQYVYDDYGTRQDGNYDPYWNAGLLKMKVQPLPEKNIGAGSAWDRPIYSGNFDDSYGRSLRDNYVPPVKKEQTDAPRRKGSEGDMPTWPTQQDIFPNW